MHSESVATQRYMLSYELQRNTIEFEATKQYMLS
jgi:hypothetical protein